MDAGLRIDHHTVTGTEWIPQVGLSVQLPQDASLKAMASKGFRNPTIRELYMFRPANPDLLPERLWNYELSYSQRLLKGTFYYGVNLFYINGDNMIQTIRTDGRPLNVNTDVYKRQAYGTDGTNDLWADTGKNAMVQRTGTMGDKK